MAKSMQELNYTVILAVLIIVVGFIAAVVYLVPRTNIGKTISVTGTAQVTVPPDRAVVYVQVVTKSNSSANEAKDLNANISNAVTTALLNTGLNRSDMETQGFTVDQEYDYGKGSVIQSYPIQSNATLVYVATNSMKVTMANFNDVGKVVDAAVNSGGLINYIDYELSLGKQNEYKATVLANASQDAKLKAESIVSGLGKSLGDIYSITTSDYGYTPYPLYSAGAASGVDVKQVATNLSPSNVDVTASVQVTYYISG